VVMEATSDYWKPVFYLLEAQGLDPWLVNARDVKHLPGRPKTDKLDAVWLNKVAERQMIRPSFVPPPQIRRLRDVTRYRIDLVGVRTAEKQRVEKLLEDAQIKLSVVASDIFGVSGREMMAALVAGRTAGRQDLVAFDMGGTTAKICLAEDLKPVVTSQSEVGRLQWHLPGRGLPVRAPMLDLIEIGTGGGSLAQVDAAGLVSAGSAAAAGLRSAVSAAWITNAATISKIARNAAVAFS